jgi:beta-glucosidase
MGRHAAGGRNWEGFGPDPYLAGVAMNASVSGIQSTGVQACSKHYIGNEQETQRSSTTTSNGTTIEAISSNIDDRTLHELYLWPFAYAIKAGTASVMCAYNRLNGSYNCANEESLQKVLKDELQFPGYVVSDWDATHSTESSANAGLDAEMPGDVEGDPNESFFGAKLLGAVNAGRVSLQRLNEMARRVMTPYFLLGQDKDFPTVDPASGAIFLTYQYGHESPLAAFYPEVPARDVRGQHAKLIREIGAAGTVLLKNVNNTLPLYNRTTSFGLFGNHVSYPTIGSVYLDIFSHPEGYETGTVDIGGGSGTVRHTNLVTPLSAITKKVSELGGRVQLLFDNDLIAQGAFNTIYPTPQACLLFLKAYATEGADRPDLELQWNATAAVESVANLCPNTIVITHTPGVVLMPWADNENVTAILAAHYPGEETGNAITDILWGKVEPSGRLPYTIPKRASDAGPAIVHLGTNVSDPYAWQSNFTEGLFTDYRYHDAYNVTPMYEFGFGLSYTTFNMSSNLTLLTTNITLSPTPNVSLGKAPGGSIDLWTVIATAHISISNMGPRAGAAVPQLYVSLPRDSTPAGTPAKVLRGFEKVFLEEGESRDVAFDVKRRDASFWDIETQEWVIPEGEIGVGVGFSSMDIGAHGSVRLLGEGM